MKYFSMFSGIGGFELGIQQAYEDNQSPTKDEQIEQGRNGDSSFGQALLHARSDSPLCIGFSEIDKYAIQIYEKHFNHKNYGDCTKIIASELPDFDLLVGGFPCQAFSVAGKRRGFSDTRGTLFFEIARILKEKKPQHLLLENVKGLLSHDGGRTFETIIRVLTDLGYSVEWQVLNSKDFGVPQNRERVFIVGHLGGGSRRKIFPLGRTNREDVQPCEEEPEGKAWVSTLDSRYGERWSTETYVCLKCNGEDKTDHGLYCKRSKIRRLTPTECERLQGFPDGWTEGISDTQRYKCLGNAVTVNVIEGIMRAFNFTKEDVR